MIYQNGIVPCYTLRNTLYAILNCIIPGLSEKYIIKLDSLCPNLHHLYLIKFRLIVGKYLNAVTMICMVISEHMWQLCWDLFR